MKKGFLKVIACVLACGLVCGVAAGCGPGGGVTVDNTRTQLYVGNYDGGLGSIWLEEFTRYFENKYADVSFEEGRVGVQIVPTSDRTFGGNTLQTTIANKQADVIFGEDIVYYNYTNGLTMDITDLVDGTWTWTVEDRDGNPVTLGSTYDDSTDTTIYAKMNESERAYYDADGRFYGVPYYYGNVTITYNEDIFESAGAFFKEGKSAEDFNERAENWDEIFGQKADGRSAGPDGLPETSDDGLPATYDDFFLLCRFLKDEGSVNGKKIMPLVICGTYNGYLLDFLETMLADAEGAEQFNLNLTGEGEAKTLGTVDGSGNFVPDAEETLIGAAYNNRNQLQRQKGRYDVLRFAYEFAHSNSFEESSMSSSGYTNIVAQNLFINGNSNYAYAMLLDGNWWESEATSTFNRLGENAKQNFNFKSMPIPKASQEDVNADQGARTYVSTNYNSVLINNNIADNEIRKNLAKLFVYEFHTNEQLSQFNSITGLVRPYEYEIDKESSYWQNMSPYAQSMYKLYVEDPNVTLLFGQTKLSIADSSYEIDNWTFYSKVDNDTYANPIRSFYQNSSLTAADYFKGLLTAHS